MPQMSPIMWTLIILTLVVVMLMMMSNMESLNKPVEINMEFNKKSNKMKW